MQGLGPTRLISPRRTLNSCGNSSRHVFRRIFPPGMMRGSAPTSSFSIGMPPSDQFFQIVPVGARVIILVHRPELHEGEKLSLISHTLLSEKHLSGRDDLDVDGDKQKQGRQQSNQDQRAHHVHASLPCRNSERKARPRTVRDKPPLLQDPRDCSLSAVSVAQILSLPSRRKRLVLGTTVAAREPVCGIRVDLSWVSTLKATVTDSDTRAANRRPP